MSLRTTNLNLLPILRALLKEVSVSRAAAEMCMSQPATSNALRRLRALLGDPLLVQVGRGMQLSPRARRLLPLLDEACVKIDALLHEARFNLADTRRSFVIEGPDYLELLLGGPLIEIFGELAPHASINFITADGIFREGLTSGEVDLAIIAWDPKIVRGYSHMHGYRDHMVGVVRRNHPLTRQTRPNAAALKAYPQLGIEPRLRTLGAMTLIGRGMRALTGHQRLGVQNFMLLPLLAAQSDCVAVVPKTLADQVEKMVPIAQVELPGQPIIIDAGILWSPIYDSDPAHRWFRGVVDGILRRHFSGAEVVGDHNRVARTPSRERPQRAGRATSARR